MDEGSITIALTARLRKRSISSHRHHSTTDNNSRTSLIKTKIQKIDGQYKASPTCPINNEEEEEQKHSSDDQDEPLIVATLPPLIQNSSKYRTRQDIYDDEAGDDQQSNSSSLDDSPTHQSESSLSAQSPMKSTIITIQKPTQSLNDNRNETINETSVDILTMPTRRSNREENIQEKSITIEESVQQRTKLTKRSNVMKSASAVTLEENPTIDSTNQTSSSSPLPFTIDETYSTTDDPTNKPTTSVDVHTSNNKPSLNTNDQTKVKVRLKTIPPSSQTNKNTKPVSNTKTTKSVEQKPLKKPSIIQKETVITTKKSTPTVTPKKPVNTSINKPPLNQNNSEKQPVRSSSKPIEKKSSDISDSTTTTPKKPIEPTPSKKPPVRLGKIPKLTPANIQKPTEKPTSSKSLTNQKSDLLAFGGNLNSNKELNTTEKNPPKLRRPSPKRRSPQRPNRPQKNPIDTSDPFLPLPSMDLDITMDKTLGKQPPISNQRYPSLLDNNPRSTSNFSRSNSIALENTQSQSPLSPGPSSTLYPPPSPPLSRSIPPLTKTLSDSRSSESLVRPSSSSNLIHTQSIPPLSSISNDPWTTNKPSNIWDSASSDEEQEDESSARRFFHQNMLAADEELSKIDGLRTSTPPPPPPADSRVEQLLKRQKKASLCLGSNGETFEENSIEPSASVDDFECVAMDIDSPKHRTQSESSDNNQTIVESNNSKSTTNGTAVSKIAELTTASSTNTSKKLTSKNRPLKATSMTLIDELKNSINPSFLSKQSVLSPPSRSLSRSRSRSRSRTHSRSRSRSRSRTRTRSRSRSRSRSSSSTSSSSSNKRRSRHRSSKRHSAKHHQRRRSASYNNDNELIENNTNNYPSAPPYYQSHHHHHSHPHQQQHWPSARQTSGLLPGPPSQPYGHQPPVPPLLPNHPYYPPPANRSLMHPVEPPGVAGSRFNFQHNPHQRHHPPLMHASYYPQAPPQPLMQSASRSHHHPMNRFPPPPRPFDIPPHPMAMANPGPHPSNSNYNQYKYESDEHVALRRVKRDTTMPGANTNNNRRGGPQQTESNGKNRMNNPSKSSDHPDMDQLRLKRDQLIAELDEITNSGDIDKDQPSSSHNKRSISSNHSNPTQLTISQDDEGEEGEISESD